LSFYARILAVESSLRTPINTSEKLERETFFKQSLQEISQPPNLLMKSLLPMLKKRHRFLVSQECLKKWRRGRDFVINLLLILGCAQKKHDCLSSSAPHSHACFLLVRNFVHSLTVLLRVSKSFFTEMFFSVGSWFFLVVE